MKEKKIRVDDDLTVPATARQLYFKAQALGTNRPPITGASSGIATLTPEKQPKENIQRTVAVAAEPKKKVTGETFRTMMKQFQSKIPPALRFFPRFRLRADATDSGQSDVSAGVVYFCLSLVAVVVIGLIITTAIVTTQKKKKNQLLLQQLEQQQRQQQVPQSLPPTMTSVAEEEIDPMTQDPYTIEALRAADRKQYRSTANDDADEDRSRIDSLITKENKHYPSAQRIQYKGPTSFSRSLPATRGVGEDSKAFPPVVFVLRRARSYFRSCPLLRTHSRLSTYDIELWSCARHLATCENTVKFGQRRVWYRHLFFCVQVIN